MNPGSNRLKSVRLVSCLLAASCSTWAYKNVRLDDGDLGKRPAPPAPPLRATFELEDASRMKDDVVVCLALSGGGSRAAWFSSAVMFDLAKIESDPDLLHQVDVISSVSGGSLAAAYFAISQDPRPFVRLSTAPRAALPACAHATLAFDAKTRLLTVTGTIEESEATKLHDACDPADGHRIDRLVLASHGCVSGREWDHATVQDVMTRDYDLRLFGNLFWPTNIALYWTTAFDRGDIMAQTFADNLFDCKKLGGSYGSDLTFSDLNPVRPLLILNSTNGTDDPKPEEDSGDVATNGPGYGNVFTFTREDFFDELHSDLSKFPIADAVMASASFPGAFPYRTLRNFNAKKRSYVHVFDGGNSDNLGLTSIKEVIRKHELERQHDSKKTTYVVICVDSYTEPRGARPRDADPRSAVDYVVDTDFFDAIDMLLKNNRYRVLADFMSPDQQVELTKKAEADESQRRRSRVQSPHHDPNVVRQATTRAPDLDRQPDHQEWEPNDLGDRLVFWHISFRDLYEKHPKLFREVNSIGTDFKIDEEEASNLEKAAHLLVTGDEDGEKVVDTEIVKKIKHILAQ